MNNLETYLSTVFDDLPQNKTVEAMYYALLNPGKRVRSQLFEKTLRSLGIEKDYHEISAAIEMIHSYSLIHDDLPAMDNATLRRGKPCVHIVYNEAIAILAGDGLLTESFKQLTKLDLQNDLKIKIINEFVDAAGCNGMIYGQELDILSENQLVSKEELSKIHRHKTGAMIVLPVRIALMIANQSALLTTMTEAMHQFGLAFQVKDDLLDACNKLAIGKDSSDEDLNKSTYLRILGKEKSEQLYYALIQACFDMIEKTEVDFTILLQYMKSIVERMK